MGAAFATIRCAVSHWSADQAATIGAALAFYCAFSIAPLLVILLTIAGWIVGAEAAYGHLTVQLTALFGKSTAEILLQAMRTRVLSFGLILAVGFLLLVSLVLSTALSAMREAIARRFTEFVVLAGVLDFVISVGLVTGLIALIYRYLPARRMHWRPILWGALVTALLFHLGRWGIAWYLGRSTQPSAFGAAASFAAMLLWLYYSAQIFLLGAEFTACFGGARQPKR